MAQWHQKQVIMALLKEYPEAASLRDVDGQTPLDYAKAGKLLPSLVESLQSDHDMYSPSTANGTTGTNDASMWLPNHIPVQEQQDDLSTIGYLEAEQYHFFPDEM